MNNIAWVQIKDKGLSLSSFQTNRWMVYRRRPPKKLLTALSHNLAVFTDMCYKVTLMHPIPQQTKQLPLEEMGKQLQGRITKMVI